MLIATIAPREGGIPEMTRFVARTLAERGYRPILGYYEPYSVDPTLSVPSLRLGLRTVGARAGTALDGYEAHAMGAWLPELEFTHYLPVAPWRRLMRACQYHLSVSGSCLAALPLALSGRDFLAWVATPWSADRRERAAQFPAPRRVLDRLVNAPVLSRLERWILRRGTIVSLSRYTQRTLDRTAHRPVVRSVLPMPVEPDVFTHDPRRRVAGRIGFVGRFCDPRKNATLLLRALRQVRDSVPGAEVVLVGDRADATLQSAVKALGITDAVSFIPYLTAAELVPWLQSLDVFVISSHQEGLCIAALQAMSCGAPVISTRCGGPEEYVIDDETGFLVDGEPASLADAICRVLGDCARHARLSRAARDAVLVRYRPEQAKQRFWDAFEHTFSRG